MLGQQEQQLEVSQHRHQWRESQWIGGAMAQNVGQRSEPHVTAATKFADPVESPPGSDPRA